MPNRSQRRLRAYRGVDSAGDTYFPGPGEPTEALRTATSLTLTDQAVSALRWRIDTEYDSAEATQSDLVFYSYDDTGQTRTERVRVDVSAGNVVFAGDIDGLILAVDGGVIE